MIPIVACTVATAPVDGRVRSHVDLDTEVQRGDVVATLESGRGTTTVHAPAAGRVAGVLTQMRVPVTAGEGILWLHR